MGMDPLTIAVAASAASGLYGAFSGNKTAQNNLNAQQQKQEQINSFAMPYLQQGENPYAAQLKKMLTGGAGGFQAPTTQQAFTFNPTLADPSSVAGTQGFNAGQDSYMQLLKTGGSPFDTSKMFETLAPLDQRLIDQQVAQLQGSAGSLGARFGTANADREAMLRRDFTQNIAARNAGIQQQSYESAQGRSMAAAGGLQQGGLQQMGLLQQLAQFNAGTQNQAGQFNAGAQTQAGQFNAAQSSAWNSFMSQILGQAGGFQNQQQGFNNQLLGIMAGVPTPQGQPNQVPGALGDISQLMMFMPFLRQAMGGAGGGAPAPYTVMPNAGNYYIPGAP